jgi:hypothetical protein
MARMDHAEFSNVSWQSQQDQDAGSSSHTMGNNDDADDDDGRNASGFQFRLECTVTHPIKENDGTKDAFMSYLVTTTVRLPIFPCFHVPMSLRPPSDTHRVVQLQLFPEASHHCPPPIHRFCLSLQSSMQGISCVGCASAARQAAHGICSRRPVRPRFYVATSLLPAAIPGADVSPSGASESSYSPYLLGELRVECHNAEPDY